MRIALHDHRAIADVGEQDVRDRRVILQQIAFRQAELRPEDLAEVREADFLAVDRHDYVVVVAWNDQARSAHLIGGNFGGRTPWSTAPATGA